MTNKVFRTLLSLFALCVCTARSMGQSYPPPFPREAARKLFENDRVAVWDVTWPKGQPTAMHEHPVDQLSVTLVGGTVRVTRPGGIPVVNTSKPGSVVFTPKGTVHMEEGLSDVAQRKIMLQLKSSESPSNTAVDAFPREGAVKLFENARAIAWDFTWKLGQRTSRNAEYRDSVIVFLDGGTIRSGSNETARNAGEVVYVPHSTNPDTEEALRGSPHAVIVKLLP